MAPYLGIAFHGLLHVIELAPFGTGKAVVQLIRARRARGTVDAALYVHLCAARRAEHPKCVYDTDEEQRVHEQPHDAHRTADGGTEGGE